MNEEKIKRLINWELPQDEFRGQIRVLIRDCQKSGKVLPIPFSIVTGEGFVDQMAMILANIDCSACDARCCKSNPNGISTCVLPPEYEILSQKYGKDHFEPGPEGMALPMPCTFLKKNLCTIYADRPLVCTIYPFQPGANNGDGTPVIALASSCPQARQLARNLYMMAWRIRQQYDRLGEVNFIRGLFDL